MALTRRQRLLPLSERFSNRAAAPDHALADTSRRPRKVVVKLAPAGPAKVKPKKPRASGASRRKSAKLAPVARALAAEYAPPVPPASEPSADATSV